MRNTSVRQLIRSYILQPLCKKVMDIHVKRSRTGKYLGITGPAKALVPLWAISGHIQEITFLSPFYIMLQLVYQWVRCGEIACWPHCRIKSNCSKIFWLQFTRITGNFY